MKFLIVGLGSIGSRHARNLLSLGQDVCVFRTKETFTEPNQGLDKLRVFTDWRQALDARPDAVVIANPSRFHMDTALDAAKQMIPLFIEKPLSDRLSDVDRLEAVLKNTPIDPVMVGFNYRFHPGLRWLKAGIENGVIGKIRHIEAEAGEYLPDWHPWEDFRASYMSRPELGGGCLENCCHEIDDVLWLMNGARPLQIYGSRLNCHELGLNVDEIADIQLTFHGDVTADIHLSMIQKPNRRILTVEGESGKAVWDYFGGQAWIDPENVPPETMNFKSLDRNEMYLSEMREFLEAVRDRRPPVVGLADGRAVLEIVDAIQQQSEITTHA